MKPESADGRHHRRRPECSWARWWRDIEADKEREGLNTDTLGCCVVPVSKPNNSSCLSLNFIVGHSG